MRSHAASIVKEHGRGISLWQFGGASRHHHQRASPAASPSPSPCSLSVSRGRRGFGASHSVCGPPRVHVRLVSRCICVSNPRRCPIPKPVLSLTASPKSADPLTNLVQWRTTTAPPRRRSSIVFRGLARAGPGRLPWADAIASSARRRGPGGGSRALNLYGYGSDD